MKKLFQFINSSKATVLFVILAIIAMGSGTFIEDKFDTLTARTWIYNTWWFELLFLLMAVNFIGHIKTFHMFRREKIGGLVFHLAFVLMIIGAGVTRYFGYEGTMRIREGESSNILYSSEPVLQINSVGKTQKTINEYNINFGPYITNKFNADVKADDGSPVHVDFSRYVANATEQFEDNAPNGTDMLELVVASESGRKKMFVNKGEVVNLGQMNMSFDRPTQGAINVTNEGGQLKMSAPAMYTRTNMVAQTVDSVMADIPADFNPKILYSVDGTVFMFFGYHPSAIKKIVSAPASADETGFDALIFNVSANGKTQEVPLLFAPGQVIETNDVKLGTANLQFGFGKKEIELPFSIHLNDFILERYPGSESPSSYASEVTVEDKRTNTKFNHRIFMNNVLDYDHFRFFQSSYDQDELGTVLSVNHDFWGTLISYTGYTLLALGFIVTLLTGRSRFLSLRHHIVFVRNKRKSMGAAVLVFFAFTATAASAEGIKVIKPEEAEKFGRVIVQTVDGRFEPVHTMAYDVMHKIARKDKFTVEGKGELTAMQVFIDMIVNPEFWSKQPIIYIKEQSVKDVLGVKTKDATLMDLFDQQGNYKLQDAVDKGFRKKPADKNNFDKEVARVDERMNVMMMVMRGSILKIFPVQGDPSSKWIAWDDEGASRPLPGVLNVINQDLKLSSLTYNNMMRLYFAEVISAGESGDYTLADKVLKHIGSIQRQGSNADVLPSEFKINAEIYYNKAQIFILLRDCYSLLSMILLLLAFIENVRSKKSKVVTIALNIGIGLLAIGFLYQTFGMILRAYLLGYAPWSNGYEALLLVSWGTVLAGFIFGRYSKLTLAATSLLAFFILMTASHSSYDPQLTNLTPVLKSYWLIIHVAVLTISYGFLGLGFVLGLINMFLYLFKTKENHIRIDLLIQELTWINEMNLTIGLVLATVGTFLGGVWANESWGRYWGWDAKETWALVIVLTYTLLLHLRLIPKMNGKYLFNVASILSFGSVLMTFFGVNYFLSKGMHSYGAGDHAIFPVWAWISIGSIILLMVAAKLRENAMRKSISEEHQHHDQTN